MAFNFVIKTTLGFITIFNYIKYNKLIKQNFKIFYNHNNDKKNLFFYMNNTKIQYFFE